MKKVIHQITIAVVLLLSILFMTVSCVSLKKFNALERDYQNCGSSQKGMEQETRSLKVENDDLKRIINELEKEAKK